MNEKKTPLHKIWQQLFTFSSSNFNSISMWAMHAHRMTMKRREIRRVKICLCEDKKKSMSVCVRGVFFFLRFGCAGKKDDDSRHDGIRTWVCDLHKSWDFPRLWPFVFFFGWFYKTLRSLEFFFSLFLLIFFCPIFFTFDFVHCSNIFICE